MGNKFFKGDLVNYRALYDADLKYYPKALGKVHAKVKAESAVSLGILTKNRSELYVFVPNIDQTHKIKEMIDLFGYIGDNHSYGEIEFDWGELPSGVWLFADGEDLKHFSDETIKNDFKSKGLCPQCGDEGYWIRMALMCPWHGRIMGI